MGMTPIDLDVLEAVLAEQIGPNAVPDIFAAYDEAMQHAAAPQDTDGSYVEMPPLGPANQADPGGDGQVSTAWGRRFTRALPDGTHAVITVAFYVENTNQDPDTSPHLQMTRQTEYLNCTDPTDLDNSELWADVRYDHVPTSRELTDDNAKALCQDFNPAILTWDGQPFQGAHPLAAPHDTEHATPQPPYGLTDAQQDSLIRLACATADEHRLWPDSTDTAYWRALASYTDAFGPDGVHELAVRTWQIIEQS